MSQELYTFFSKIDILMQYYMFESDNKPKGLCATATLYGLYKYNRLPICLRHYTWVYLTDF